MDATKTTFKDEEFDVIRGTGILHHLDIKLSLNEIKRILKNSGSAFFVEPLDTNPLIKLFRKLTPKMRTADEQPLRKKEIKTITDIFPNTEIYYSSFLTLLAVPFRNSKQFAKILSILSIADNIVLHNKSPFKWLAWRCLIIMKK
jgi:ubiquinone/menaquinone biosynthesis C-methylase UbiE